MNSNGQIVQLKNITKVYSNRYEKYAAVKDINFCAERGKLTLILGPSGSGKTTLLTIMAGFLKPTNGEVYLFGKNVNDYSPMALQRMRTEKISFVFQTFLLIDSLTVYENIALVNNFLTNKPRDGKIKILAAMEKVGISHLCKKRPFELSHGERQRVAIARALMNSSELIIADEPTASIEAKQAENIINLLANYATESNTCVIVASHDLRLKQRANNFFIMENGTIKEGFWHEIHSYNNGNSMINKVKM